MEYLSLGVIAKPYSYKGEVKIMSNSDFSESRYTNPSQIFYLADRKNNIIHELHAISFKKSGGYDVVLFENINSEDEARKLVGLEVLVEKDNSMLKEDEYYFSDLVGCKIINFATNEEIGVVEEVENLPAQYTLRVKFNKRIYYVPFVDAFIKEVNIEEKYIKINVIDGLLWELLS